MDLEFNLSVQGMGWTYNDMALAAGVNAPLQKRAIKSVMSMMTGVAVDGQPPAPVPERRLVG